MAESLRLHDGIVWIQTESTISGHSNQRIIERPFTEQERANGIGPPILVGKRQRSDSHHFLCPSAQLSADVESTLDKSERCEMKNLFKLVLIATMTLGGFGCSANSVEEDAADAKVTAADARASAADANARLTAADAHGVAILSLAFPCAVRAGGLSCFRLLLVPTFETS